MQITVNGDPREAPSETTVAALLAELKLAPEYVAVEVNRDVVPRQRHAQHVLQEGDQLEIVTLVGGG